MEVPEEQKVKIVSAKLKKHASISWENLKRKRKREGKSKIKTWEKMRQKLIRKYLPPCYYQENFKQLQLSKTSSNQPFSSSRNHTDYHKPLIHQPIFSFRPQHSTIEERNTNIPKCFICEGYGHIAIDCVNPKVVTIFNGEIHGTFEEEREDIDESFEETMGEPIYDEEYVGVDFREVFKEDGERDPIYDDEYVPDDIREVFEKEDNNKPIYDEEYLPTEYGESLEVKRSLPTTTTKEEL